MYVQILIAQKYHAAKWTGTPNLQNIIFMKYSTCLYIDWLSTPASKYRVILIDSVPLHLNTE